MTAAGLALATATLLGLGQAGTLEQATIRIVVDEAGATVALRYLITQPPEVLVLNAMRLPGHRFLLLDLPDEGPPARQSVSPGLVRFTFSAGRRDTLALAIRYRVQGPTHRIPIFVPETPTNPPSEYVEILVAGVPPDRVAPNRVPRFEALADGTLRATPDHVPGLVAVVRQDGGPSFPAVMQWGVIAIAVAGTLFWAAWARHS